jgi:aryl-alcohol dehydrogenase-like predicted oxidoreductase
MNRVQWPECGLELSKLAFGCAPVMGRISRREALSAMSRAYDAGVTHFDVARSYGFGDAEAVVGQFASAHRSHITLTTKFGIAPVQMSAMRRLARPVVRQVRRLLPATQRLVKQNSAALLSAGHYTLQDAQAGLQTSLRALGTDYVDLLLVHDCIQSSPVEPDVIEWMEKMRELGTIRAWGFATGGRDADYYDAGYRDSRAIHQRELRLEDLGTDGEGRIGHSPFRLLQTFRDKLAADPARSMIAWANANGMAAEDLPELLREILFLANDQRVILCSMFQAEHIRTNVRPFSAARFPAALRQEFTALLGSDGVPQV